MDKTLKYTKVEEEQLSLEALPVNIFVYKTNIRLKKDIKRISPALDNCKTILNWNVDQADIDNVLRVISTCVDAGEIIHLINQEGYSCEELT